MSTNYDPIAEQYRRSKQTPWRTHIECFTLFELVGDLMGRTVLDVACGEGFYTRQLRHRGAAKIVGVDLSPRMIELAHQQEAECQLGIEYLVGDARNLDGFAESDLVVAAYLLNYATNRSELTSMCHSIARCLKPGGRFVTINSNPALDFRIAPSYRRYKFETRLEGDLIEGTPLTWTFFLDEGSFSIENYFLPVSVHEEVLRQAGFREVRWHAPRLSPQGETEYGRDFWQPFMEAPPVTFIECLK
jgi:toxoflavin synthase